MTSNHLQPLLLRSGLVTPAQLKDAIEATRGSDSTWLEQLLLLGAIDEERLRACVADRARVPCCEPDRFAAIPGPAIACVPPEVAAEHWCVPLELEPDGDLRLAMLDPTDSEAIEVIEFFCGRRLLREAAHATPLGWALRHYYRETTRLWPRAKPLARLVAAPAATPPGVEILTESAARRTASGRIQAALCSRLPAYRS